MSGLIYLVITLSALFLLWFNLRYKWWRAAKPDHLPRVLMYHMVSEHRPKAKFNKLRVTPTNFEQQLRWLSKQGYYFALMSELSTPEKLPAKTVAITFDDGFADNLLNADPILERYSARATLYLVQDRFDRDWSTSKKAHHDSGELMREDKLTDQQVQHMLGSGRWQLGGHTITHANLAKLNAEQKLAEIKDSKLALEQQFNTELSSFAYPFGIYDQTDVTLAEQAGFSTAVTTVEAIDDDISAHPYELSRVKVSGKDSMLAFKVRMRCGQRG